MDFDLSILNPFPYISMPSTILGWIGWGISVAAFVFLAWRWRQPSFPSKDLKTWLIFLAFVAAVIVTTLFFGFRFAPGLSGNHPTLGGSGREPILMVFMAIPWVLAAGVLGPEYAALLAVISGLLTGIFETHNLFTLVEYGMIALLMGYCVRQNYRTRFFQFIRHPLGAAVFLNIIQVPLIMLCAFLAVNGRFAGRVDYALTRTWPVMITHSIEFLIGGLFAEVFFIKFRQYWFVQKSEQQPSPAETHLQLRIFSGTVPYILVLIFVLIWFDWRIAVRTSHRMQESQLSTVSAAVTGSLPVFFETGQNLMAAYAAPELMTLSPDEISKSLSERMQSVNFFSEWYVFNVEGQLIAGFPSDDIHQAGLSGQEIAGLGMVQQGKPFQVFTVPARMSGLSADVSFMSAICDSQGNVQGILLGRTDLGSNPFTFSVVQSMQHAVKLGGEGMILDENNTILYHTNPAMVFQPYYGRIEKNDVLYNDVSSTGKHMLAFHQDVPNSTWSVLFAVPAEQSQQVAVTMVLPLFVLLMAGFVLMLVVLQKTMGSVLAGIHSLEAGAQRIADGDLDHAVSILGEDEVGRLGKTFDRMRLSLKTRLHELNQLLGISRGVAGSLETQDSILPILKAALFEEDVIARIMLETSGGLESDDKPTIAFGCGENHEQYAYLDEQLFDLMRDRDMVSVSNTQRWRGVQFDLNPRPGALYAFALCRDDRYYGVMWLGCSEPKMFSDSEIHFLNALADQAVIAASNSRFYSNAELGRQRLMAVLASIPDPMIVTDEQSRLFLFNPAALQLDGLLQAAMPGSSIQESIANQDLVNLIQQVDGTGVNEGVPMLELTFQGNSVYYATVAPIFSDNKVVGKVTLLKDISHFRELDRLKSEFVEYVSHDLRGPLTMMGGYVMMLDMVGPVNEQQAGFISKITASIKYIQKLVKNLLDLSRLETGSALKIENVIFEEIIQWAIDSLKAQAAQRNVEIDCQYPADQQTMIEADRSLIYLAVYNLLENGIQFTPSSGFVTIRFVSHSGTVRVDFEDNGIGISPIDLPHIFEKFYCSGRTESILPDGAGLGLTIVKSIIEKHGGQIHVSSTLGKGSIFTVEIPIQQSAVK